jgi:inner membrane protein
MDSVSQAVLGAAVGVAVMGRRRPFWQSALAGAMVGTLPDLDVFIDKGDPVNNMVLHRAESHAIFYQFLVSLPIAYLLALLSRSTAMFKRWWLLTTLVLVTHTVLDALTVYGTRLALPFSDHPFGLGSIFIIDPLYTLPLIFGLLIAAISRSEKRFHWNRLGLVVSTLYLGWGIGVQAYVTDKVMQTPQASGFQQSQVLVTPTPFNSILWRIVLRQDGSYYEGYYSLFDPLTMPDSSIQFTKYDRGLKLDQATQNFVKANQVRHFSKGFYALSSDGRYATITDLRMGFYPYYAFSFHIGEYASPLREIEPQRISRRIPLAAGLRWLKQRILGQQMLITM